MSEQLKDRSFVCVRDGERHTIKEVAFNLPAAAFALSLPEAERAPLRELQNEDAVVIGDAHFVRGWAGMPVQHHEGLWGFGLWLQISAADFSDFEKHRRIDHPKYLGKIANQGLYGAPILGTHAEMEFRGAGQRPFIRFTGAEHPLTALQRSGVNEALWRKWMSEAFHDGERAPAETPFVGTLETAGWAIREPDEVGKVPTQFAKPPKVGDTVKVVMEVLTADRDGEPITITAGWWVRLDDVSRTDLWSGTLASHTRVEATLMLGSRIWLRPKQVIQHAPGDAAGG